MEKSSGNNIDINQFTNLLSGKPSTYVPERYRNGKQNNGWNFQNNGWNFQNNGWNFMDEIMKYSDKGKEGK